MGHSPRLTSPAGGAAKARSSYDAVVRALQESHGDHKVMNLASQLLGKHAAAFPTHLEGAMALLVSLSILLVYHCFISLLSVGKRSCHLQDHDA
jgi:hypothetical protein